MESKRKRLSMNKSENKQIKKLKEEGKSVQSFTAPLVEKKEETVTKTEVPKKRPLSGPIVSCFLKQQEEETKNVTCPMCNSLVLYKNINQHLDDGCQERSERSSSSVQGCEFEIKDNDLVSTPREKKLISARESNALAVTFQDDLEAIILLESDESSVEMLNDEKDDRLISEFLFNDDNVTSDNKNVNTESLSENNGLETNRESNNDQAMVASQLASKNGELEPRNSQLEPKIELHNDETATSPTNKAYLQNFMFIMTTVLSQKDDKELFNDSDNTVVKSFQGLSDESKMLYVRLFQRKYKWFRTSNIKYPRISENLQPCFDELIKTGFLHTEIELDDLTEIFNLLSAGDVQELAKSMHIQTKTQSKKNLVNALMKQTKTQCSLFSTNGDRIQMAIMKRAKSLLGSCVKLESEPRNVFSRVILLFTLNLMRDDDDNYGAQLSSIFLTNVGKIVYPSYEISRQTAIFQDRDDVISYDLANQDLCHMDHAIERKNFDEAIKIYWKVHEQFVEALKKLRNGDPRLIYSVKLPVHLRRFTATWLFTKMCSRGVDLLQRNKEYVEAVELLRQLLGQNEFCSNHRGWWWERLSVNLDQHLKTPAEALNAVREALADVRVKTGHRLALEERAKKICQLKRNSSLKKYLSEIKFTELREPNVETISGKRLELQPVFVLSEVNTDGSNDNEVLNYCGVEEMALRYYRKQGYNEGIHGEGLTFSMLFTLLMWDVIFYDSVPDVFRTPFQAAPLDIYSENFYANRKKLIDERLHEIENASVEKLTEWIKAKWLEQEGKTCVGIKWELFSGVRQIMGLARCMGSKIIAGICERFAKDYRHTRSGLPDLVVWNCTNLKYKIVEVKGPNDKLSTKQQVWLDVLVRLGADAEVLYVKAVGGRKLN